MLLGGLASWKFNGSLQIGIHFVFSLSLATIQRNFDSDNVRGSVLLCFTFMLYFRQEDESAGEILEKRYKDRLLCVHLVF